MQAVPPPAPALDFDPDRPINWTPSWHDDVTLVPWVEGGDRGARRAAGLFDAQGTFLPEGHCWRYDTGPITLEPAFPTSEQAPERLVGRWLYGGLFYGHFGHFLCETTSRLWALDALGPIAGIVFLPKQHLTHERRHFRHQLPFFAAMGLDDTKVTFRVPQQPVIIDQLAIPEPGFGIGNMIKGRPEYRQFMQSTLGADVAAQGGQDLYISRSQLPSKRGSVLLETLIETRMEKAGYSIFHPQNHDITEQIAAYKAARRIVSLDASSLHLAAMVVSPDTKVAIINRGPTNNIEDYVAQFTSWQGRAPTRIEAVSGVYGPEGRRTKKREAHAALSFPAIGAALAKDGFLPAATKWTAPTKLQTTKAVAALSERVGETLTFQSIEG
ncbi:glycosyltransferase 61 family protein [Gymnodinialimonas sp. 57CJ19]|uniref:glycosyltransferase family 61 protein n=1 Tax=Gymnodinialimonas sp. 57CJ19 TaxID=3138498 RepID=UPI0031344EFA